METIEEKIEKALDNIRPYLEKDGGNVELVNVKDNEVFLRLLGNCRSCEMSQMTMTAGIEETIKKSIPSITAVYAIDD